ncbi:MAG TPA: hypothetical protein P5164_20380, partial [Thermoanaerobaculia bacterium]|nr:hypothetical protein [Thermoanaerobaculia bacterium]
LPEAGGALVGNPLPEWATRLAALRIGSSGDPARAGSEIERLRREAALVLPARERRRYAALAHWLAWTARGGGRAASR